MELRAKLWCKLSSIARRISEFCWSRMRANGYMPVYREGTNKVLYFKPRMANQHE